MTQQSSARRLAAIVCTDVVGYSRLMGGDDEGTLAALKALRSGVVDPRVAEHGGTIVKETGDGALIEFPSVVNALRCAIEVQRDIAGRGEGDAGAIRLRIGVHLGDVIAENGDIFGDGVNVAARLEALAAPGGIAISDVAHDSVGGRLADGFRDAGEHALKNIARPVRVWRWTPGLENEPQTAERKPEVQPSIAVLPFANMSGDPEQSYLADGIAEDILTGLARVRWLIVTSRNSSFAYRGDGMDLRKVARELGVRYVLEGSVRRAGERVRITAQLIDGIEDRHLWAERFDRKLADIFDLQDEITASILGAIEPELGLAEQARARRKPPESLGAWDLYLRGQWHLFRYTAEDNALSKDFFRRAIALDPEFASSHAGLAYACHLSIVQDFTDDPAASVAEGVKAARCAAAIDDKDAMIHSVAARILSMNRELDAAVMAGQAAVALNPNIAQVRHGYAQPLIFIGRPEDALAQLADATRLSPQDPNLWAFMTVRAWALLTLERYEEAADWARRAAAQPTAMLWTNAVLATALGHLGQEEEARAALSRLRKECRHHDPMTIWDILPFRDRSTATRLNEGLRNAQG